MMGLLKRFFLTVGNRFLDLSIKKKLLVTYLSVSLFPILFIATMTYNFSTYYLQRNAGDYAMRIVKQLNNNIERNLVYMDNLASFISYNEDVHVYIRSDASMPLRQKYDMEYRIENFLINTTGFNPLVSEIMVLCLRNKDMLRVSKEGNYSAELYPENEPWYKDVFSDPNFRKIIILEDAARRKYYCVSRKIVDGKTQELIGVVLVKCDIGTVNEMTKDFDFGSMGFLGITDREGRVIFFSGNAVDAPSAAAFSAISGENAYRATLAGERMLVSSNVSPFSGWAITCYLRVDAINRDVSTMLYIILLVSLLCLFVVLLAAHFLSRALSDPLRFLEEAVEEVKLGNFDVRIPVPRNDEIGRLSVSFNEMVERINALISTVYKLELKEKEAELGLLQAQINPHFLYNTLESIRSLAILNDDYDAAETITDLGKFLRLKIESRSGTISISRELEHAESYFSLLKLKYREVAFVRDVEPEILEYSIVPIVFQPIIENCLKHGFKGNSVAGTVMLRGRRVPEGIRIEIEDDGVGVGEEEAAALNGLIAEEKVPGSGGVGLQNVNTRLRLVFGEAYGLAVARRNGGGTVVSIRLPPLSHKGSQS